MNYKPSIYHHAFAIFAVFIAGLICIPLPSLSDKSAREKNPVPASIDSSNPERSSVLEFYLESADCHPKPYAGEVRYYGSTIGVDRNDRNYPIFRMENEQKASRGTRRETEIGFWIGRLPFMFRKQLQPYGREATLVFTEHPDGSSVDSIKAVYLGTSDETSPGYMKQGFIGHGLKVTRGEWLEHGFNNYGFSFYTIHPSTGKIISIGEFDIHHPDETQREEACKKLESYIDGIPDGYIVTGISGDSISPELKKRVVPALAKIGSKAIQDIWAYDNWCIVGRKGAKIGEASESLVRSRFSEDKGYSRKAELDIQLISPPIRIHLISSGKYDDDDVVMDIYDEHGDWLLPPDLPTSKPSTGILDCKARKKIVDLLYAKGIEIVPHTIRPTLDLDRIDRGLALFDEYYKSRSWIDHGYNFEDLVRYGYKKDSNYYILDRLEGFGYDYAWNWWDMGFYIPDKDEFDIDDYPFNMLYPERGDKLPILFYRTTRMDHDLSDGVSITLYNAHPMSYILDKPWAYEPEAIDTLIDQRGVHITHNYFTNVYMQFSIEKEGYRVIHPTFEKSLAYIEEKMRSGTLWNPTVSEFGDYVQSTGGIEVVYVSEDEAKIINHNRSPVKGFTLACEGVKADEVTINKKSVQESGNFKYLGEELLFWCDLAAGEEKIIKAGRSNAQRPEKQKFHVMQDDKGVKLNMPAYQAEVNEVGILSVYSREGILLIDGGTFEGIYTSFTLTNSTSKPAIDIDDRHNELLISLKWQGIENIIDLEIDYEFNKSQGEINAYTTLTYLEDLMVQEERLDFHVHPPVQRILDHTQRWTKKPEVMTYPWWLPAFATFGKGNDSVHLYGRGNATKTVIEP